MFRESNEKIENIFQDILKSYFEIEWKTSIPKIIKIEKEKNERLFKLILKTKRPTLPYKGMGGNLLATFYFDFNHKCNLWDFKGDLLIECFFEVSFNKNMKLSKYQIWANSMASNPLEAIDKNCLDKKYINKFDTAFPKDFFDDQSRNAYWYNTSKCWIYHIPEDIEPKVIKYQNYLVLAKQYGGLGEMGFICVKTGSKDGTVYVVKHDEITPAGYEMKEAFPVFWSKYPI
jgi:hypothetical protein